MKTRPEHIVYSSLTKREWFAGLAMQSICQDRTAVYSIESIAKGAVEYADTLIKCLNDTLSDAPVAPPPVVDQSGAAIPRDEG